MAKRKIRKKVQALVRRVRAPTVVEAPRRKVASRSGAGWKTTLAFVAGGAGGALAGGLAVKAGVSPKTAAVGVTLLGGVGAFALSGTVRTMAGGAAAAGAGQIALAWLAHHQQKQGEKAEAPRQGLQPGDIHQAFRDAKRDVRRSPLHIVEEEVAI